MLANKEFPFARVIVRRKRWRILHVRVPCDLKPNSDLLRGCEREKDRLSPHPLGKNFSSLNKLGAQNNISPGEHSCGLLMLPTVLSSDVTVCQFVDLLLNKGDAGYRMPLC